MVLNASYHMANQTLTERLEKIEKKFDSDCISYNGQIAVDTPFILSKIISELAAEKKHENLVFILTTSGGSILAVERIVKILRQFYKKVIFIIPDYAYSAGTLLCMSGDEIYMNFYSVLGPIDPQVQNKDGRWVSALSYLDKIEELIKKSENNTITSVEFAILKEFDLAELKEFEKAAKYSKEVLINHLLEYKFKSWNMRTDLNIPVTPEYKKEKAEEIAEKLGSNAWYSHGRPIHINKLEEMGIQINDYSGDEDLTQLICDYYYSLEDFIRKNDSFIFIHTRRFF